MIFPQQSRADMVVQGITRCYGSPRIIALISTAQCGLYRNWNYI